MSIANCLAEALLTLFERREEIRADLLKQGFDEALMFEQFLDGFAKSQEEQVFSLKVRQERDRREAWLDCVRSGWESGQNVVPVTASFKGNWLDQLLELQRKALFLAGDIEHANDYSILDLDPCWSAWKQWETESHANWRYQRVDLLANRLAHREEIGKRKGIPLQNVADDSSAIRNFVSERFLVELDDKGFKRIKASDPHRVLLSKRLASNQELRFSIVANGDWSFSKFGELRCFDGVEPKRYSWPNLLIMSLGVHRRPQEKPRFSDIPDAIIPFWRLPGFEVLGNYCYYSTPMHIAVVLAEWAALYRMIADDIERLCFVCGDVRS